SVDRRRAALSAGGGVAADVSLAAAGGKWLQLPAGIPLSRRGGERARRADHLCRGWPRGAGAARLRTATARQRSAGPQACLPDVQLLHGPDALEGKRAGSVRDGLSTVRP